MPRPVDLQRRKGESDEAFSRRLAAAAAARSRKARSRQRNASDGVVTSPTEERVVTSSSRDFERDHELFGSGVVTPREGRPFEPKTPTLYGVPVVSGSVSPAVTTRDYAVTTGAVGAEEVSQGTKYLGKSSPPAPARDHRDNSDNESESSREVTQLIVAAVERLAVRIEQALPRLVEDAVRKALQAKPDLPAVAANDAEHEGVLAANCPSAFERDNAAPLSHVVTTLSRDYERDNKVRDNGRDNVPASPSDNALDLDAALRAGWLWTLWNLEVLSHEAASRPWTAADALALEEAYRTASTVALPEDAYGVLMTWVELYARDALVPPREKAPRHFLRRLHEYLGAPVPSRDRFQPADVVRAWEQLVGVPMRSSASIPA